MSRKAPAYTRYVRATVNCEACARAVRVIRDIAQAGLIECLRYSRRAAINAVSHILERSIWWPAGNEGLTGGKLRSNTHGSQVAVEDQEGGSEVPPMTSVAGAMHSHISSSHTT